MQEKIKEIVIKCVEETIKEWDIGISCSIDEFFPIFSKNSNFSSMNIVSLIVNIEDEIENIFGKKIILANDRAFSLENSPFKNINSITEYINKILG